MIRRRVQPGCMIIKLPIYCVANGGNHTSDYSSARETLNACDWKNNTDNTPVMEQLIIYMKHFTMLNPSAAIKRTL